LRCGLNRYKFPVIPNFSEITISNACKQLSYHAITCRRNQQEIIMNTDASSAALSIIRKSLILLFTVTALASCGGSSSPVAPRPVPTPVTVTSLSATVTTNAFATTTDVAKGAQVEFSAVENLSDGSTNNVSTTATWSTDNAAVLAFETTGRAHIATAKTVGGPVTVTATSGGFTATVDYSVVAAVPAALTISPATVPQVAIGEKGNFTAIYTMTDKTTGSATDAVAWASSNGAAVIVSDSAGSKGQAVANSAGSSNISASFGALKSQNVAVTVFQPGATPAFLIGPDKPNNLPRGRRQQFRAIKYYAASARTVDVTSEVVWNVSNAAIAQFPNDSDIPKGMLLASPTMSGTLTITATDPKNAAVTAPVTVNVTNPSISSYVVTPVGTAGNPLAVGQKRQLGVTATFSDRIARDITQTLDWTAGGLGHLSVTNGSGKKGLVTANQETPTGTANDTIVINDPVSTQMVTHAIQTGGRTLLRIDIAPTNTVDIALGSTQQFEATGIFSTGEKQPVTNDVTWESSAKDYVTISNNLRDKGRATAIKAGASAVIEASYQVGGTVVRSNKTVASVTSPTLQTIEIRPTTAVNLAVGRTTRLYAWGNFSDGVARDLSDLVTWSSSANSTATVSNAGRSKGVVTSEAIGTVSIRAVEPNTMISSSKPVTVSGKAFNGISISPAGPVSSPIGIVYKEFIATADFSDGTTEIITRLVQWKSSNNATATPSNNENTWGYIYPRAAGDVQITAEAGAFVSPPVTFTVSAGTLQSIAITPAGVVTPSPAIGDKVQFSATGTYSDTSTKNITTAVTWESDDRTTAFITNNAPNGQMVATGSGGVATITAKKDGITSNATQVVPTGTVNVRTAADVDGGCCDGQKVAIEGRVDEVISAVRYRFQGASSTILIEWSGPNPLPSGQDIRVIGVRNPDDGKFTVSSYSAL
jgi:hypothetical protein